MLKKSFDIKSFLDRLSYVEPKITNLELDTKIFKVYGYEKDKYPYLLLGGNWLSEIGFDIGRFANIDISNGLIIIRLFDDVSFDDSLILKQIIRKQYQKFLSVIPRKKLPVIQIKGKSLLDNGFKPQSHVLVKYEYGVIRLRLIESSKLGV